MSSVIGALRVNLGLDAAQFEKGAKGADRTLKRMRGQFLAAAAAAVALGTAVAAMARQAMQTIDAQAKLARAVGGTTAAMQALERAAERSGVQQSELAAAATRLNQRLGQVMTTGKGAEGTFRALGISAAELAAMDIDERFSALSDAMVRAGMNTQEMSFHLRELGIRQSSVITLIQGGSEEIRRSRQAVDDFGVAVSDVDAAQIERANDALSEVGRVFEGLRNQIAVAVAPAIERMANAFTDLARAGQPINVAIRTFVDNLERLGIYISVAVAALGIRYVAAAALAFTATASLTGALTLLRGALLRTGIGILVVGAGEVVYRFSQMTETVGGFSVLLDQLGHAAGEFFGGLGDLAMASAMQLGNVWNRIKADFTNMLSGMAQQFSSFLVVLAGAFKNIPVWGDQIAGAMMTQAAQMEAATVRLAREGRELNTTFEETAADAQALAEGGLERLRTAFEGVGVSSQTFGQGLTDGAAAADEMRRALTGLTGSSMEDPEDPAGGGGGRSPVDDAIDGLERYQMAMQMTRDAGRSMVGELIGLFGALGQRSRAFAAVAVAVNAAQAVSEIMANTAAASVRALRDLGPIAGPPAAARIALFGKAQAAIAAASGVLRLGAGSGGGGGLAAAAGGASAAPAAALPVQRVVFDMQGQQSMGMDRLVEMINEAGRKGYRLDIQTV